MTAGLISGAISPPPPLLEDLKRRYGEPHRAYHGWSHIEALLEHCQNNARLIHRPTPVLWAVLWHDAIDDPRQGDNEEQSAQLFRRDAEHVLAPADIALADALICATAKHELPPDLRGDDRADCGFFLDIDLSILASAAAVFDRYEAGIRREYEFVPEPQFRQARAAILKRFLDRPQLYFTPALATEWESRARANLARSIARLTSSQS